MKKTILVPTDLSSNSKAGIRFAIQLAGQGKYSLVFLYCIPYLKPTRWSDARYAAFAEKERQDAHREALAFIRDTYGRSGGRIPKINCIVTQSADAARAIIDHAEEIGATAICMGTRGAGRLKKLIGNHASAIISSSPVPAFIVPGNYRRTGIKNLAYASDMENVGKELKVVKILARLLDARVSVLHYNYLADVPEAEKKLRSKASRYKSADVKFHFRKLDITRPWSVQLMKDLRILRASLAVLFTDRKRGWFDKIFLSNRTKEVAFQTRLPLLVYAKNAR